MKALRHVGITIRDIETVNFYRDVLGLRIKKEMLETGNFIDNLSALKKVRVKTIKMSADDGSLVELLYYESHRRKPTMKDICDIGCSHIAFTVENIDREYEKLKDKGIRFSCIPQVSPDGKARVVFCRDPEGNLIEMVEELD